MKNDNVVAGLLVIVTEVLDLPAYLAGGCVRDYVHGIKPKDYDFLIPNTENLDPADVFHVMSGISEQVSRWGLGSSCIYQGYDQSVDDFNDHCLGAMSVKCNGGTSFDLIFRKEPTLEAAIDFFDCNMNKYWYDHVADKIHGSFPEELEFRPGILTSRIEYMREKFKFLKPLPRIQ